VFVSWTVVVAAAGADGPMRVALHFGGALAVSAILSELGILRLRASQRVGAFPAVLLAQKFVVFVGGGLAAMAWGFGGALGVMVGAECIAFVVVTTRLLPRVRYVPIVWREVTRVMRIGLPVMVAGALDGVVSTLDRVFLARTVTAYDIGIYQFATIPVMLGLAVSTMTNQYVNPRILSEFGADGSLRRVFRNSATASMGVAAAMLVGWPVFDTVMASVVVHWLPAYVPSLPLMRIFYVGAIFVAATPVHVTINAANRQPLYVVTASIVAIVCIGGYVIVSAWGAGLAAYAAVASGGLALATLLHLAFAWRCVTTTGRVAA
jgi:O-antigen/teichoic acid export membrane protein